MTTREAIRYFGSVSLLADALGITREAVYQWGTMVPAARAYQLEVLTGGDLKASDRAA